MFENVLLSFPGGFSISARKKWGGGVQVFDHPVLAPKTKEILEKILHLKLQEIVKNSKIKKWRMY